MCDKLCESYLCKKCENVLKQQLENNEDVYKDKFFNSHYYMFAYEDDIRRMLIDYKFNEKPYLFKTFSQIILNDKKIYSILHKYDIIIPVPLSKRRKLNRGYNQAELIIKEVSKTIQLNLETNILKKVVNIKPQSTLNSKQREENIKNAYIANEMEKIKNKNILIFDDVYTTGSTLNECARVLKSAEAKNIDVFTIAKNQKKR